MKIIFSVSEFGTADVNTSFKYEPLACALRDLHFEESCDMVMDALREIRKGVLDKWEMSWNSAFMRITQDEVFLEKLWLDRSSIVISLEQFEKIVAAWRNFLTISSKNKFKVIHLNSL